MSTYGTTATVSDGTVATSTTSGALKVTGGTGIGGACHAGVFRTVMGSQPVNGTGTFYIALPPWSSGRLTCHIDAISNGIWASSGDFVSTATNTRVNLSNIVHYQFSGNNISANLQPFGGGNTAGSVNESNQVQVVISGLGAPSTLRWTYTLFHVM